jgi:hypothetical protein
MPKEKCWGTKKYIAVALLVLLIFVSPVQSNSAPVITGVFPPPSSYVGESATLSVTATDADADLLSYNFLVKAPNGIYVSGTQTDGSFAFTPYQSGTYTVTVEVSDSKLTTKRNNMSLKVSKSSKTYSPSANFTLSKEEFSQGETVDAAVSVMNPNGINGYEVEIKYWIEDAAGQKVSKSDGSMSAPGDTGVVLDLPVYGLSEGDYTFQTQVRATDGSVSFTQPFSVKQGGVGGVTPLVYILLPLIGAMAAISAFVIKFGKKSSTAPAGEGGVVNGGNGGNGVLSEMGIPHAPPNPTPAPPPLGGPQPPPVPRHPANRGSGGNSGGNGGGGRFAMANNPNNHTVMPAPAPMNSYPSNGSLGPSREMRGAVRLNHDGPGMDFSLEIENMNSSDYAFRAEVMSNDGQTRLIYTGRGKNGGDTLDFTLEIDGINGKGFAFDAEIKSADFSKPYSKENVWAFLPPMIGAVAAAATFIRAEKLGTSPTDRKEKKEREEEEEERYERERRRPRKYEEEEPSEDEIALIQQQVDDLEKELERFK